jgi:uncharacterized protein (TIGR02145 family)
MLRNPTIKIIAAFAAFAFMPAFSQEEAVATVPVKANVSATVSIQPPNASYGTGATHQVSAGGEKTFTLILKEGTPSTQILPPQGLANASAASYSLFSLNGKRVWQGVNLSQANVAKGVYIILARAENGNAIGTKLVAHNGGKLNENITFSGKQAESSQMLRKEAGAYGRWIVTATAEGYSDTAYFFDPVEGPNPLQNITLRKSETVTIGSQVWLKRNLNVMLSRGSWCYGEEYEERIAYKGDVSLRTLTEEQAQANCDKYGRLYNWAAAMDLPEECNYTSCASRIEYPHRGICPQGFHIPTRDEWFELLRFTVGSRQTIEQIFSGGGNVHKYLSAQQGWFDCGPATSIHNYVCEDTYGFSALPGGMLSIFQYGPLFGGIDIGTSWWSANEEDADLSPSAFSSGYSEHEISSGTMGMSGGGTKLAALSVRCIQDLPSNHSGQSLQNITYGEPVNYAGETYQTVVIGSQTWLKRNLNAMPNNGTGKSWCYDNKESNCNLYGRLYDWAAAMNLPEECNEFHFDNSYCNNLIQPRHRGLCPEGFHVPRSMDWNKLFRFTDGSTFRRIFDGPTAGRYLKAQEGWQDCGPAGSGKPYLCEDTYGFSALPGGKCHGDSWDDWDECDFRNAGLYGDWWNSGDYAQKMNYNSDYAYRDLPGTGAMALRCVKYNDDGGSSSSSLGSSSSQQIDYETVSIGLQTWLKRNLNVMHNSGRGLSRCYFGEDKSTAAAATITEEESCERYGRLYEWAAAMDLPSECNFISGAVEPDCAISPKHRGLCPQGFHVPTHNEWKALVAYIESEQGEGRAGRHLKAQSGWRSCGNYSIGDPYLCEDTYGFSALPGGFRWGADYDYGRYEEAGTQGNWWSNTYSWQIKNSSERADSSSIGGLGQFSVRCIKDTPSTAGNGTSESPYIITTAGQLAALAIMVNAANPEYNAAHYKLANNINLSGYASWKPIGISTANSFKGVFDGNGKIISGLAISASTNFQGLFGYIVGGTVKNLGVENIFINASGSGRYLGGIAGRIDNSSTISNCYTTGRISGNANDVGGLVGRAEIGNLIENSYSTAAVSGANDVGGLVGSIINSGNNITNCAALNPSVAGTGANVGRISGSTAATRTNNVAFIGMLNASNTTEWSNKGLTARSGEDITAAAILADGTLGGRFASPIWATQNGKLPGFGVAAEMAGHLR